MTENSESAASPDEWPEIEKARLERRHEINLSGPEIATRLQKSNGQLHPNLFRLRGLNFLEISNTGLEKIPDDVKNFKYLTNLALFSNNLKIVSPIIGCFDALKYLDLSRNKIESLPDDLGQLNNLQVLNVRQNLLKDLPDMGQSVGFLIVDASYNKFEKIPEWLCSPKLERLHDVLFNDNTITELPPGLSTLPSLKTLNLQENSISIIPGEIADAPKLKDLLLKGNKLADRRLMKLVNDSHKSMLEYISRNCPRTTSSKDSKNKKNKRAKSKRKGDRGDRDSVCSESDSTDVLKSCIYVMPSATPLRITCQDAVANVRQYLVCCVARGLDLYGTNLKRFIALQTKLHKTVCRERQAATIATHDLRRIKAPLVYTCRKPDDIVIQPLMRSKEFSARELVKQLKEEAELLRKEKKRNTYSGVHQYLYLVKPWNVYPCFIDAEDTVISFPPITNSDLTKITQDTTHVMIEVTSSESLDTAKTVMDQLIFEMLELDIGRTPCNLANPEGKSLTAAVEEFPPVGNLLLADQLPDVNQLAKEIEGGGSGPPRNGKSDPNESDDVSKLTPPARKELVIEQVRILSQDGSLRVAYPSKLDLETELVEVIREWGGKNWVRSATKMEDS